MIKTICAIDPRQFDDLVNEFENNNNVFATQTHINWKDSSFVAVIFYRPKGTVLK